MRLDCIFIPINPFILSFNPTPIIEQLALNRLVFDALFTTGSKNDILFRPAPAKWNLLEILCHLVDEETDDFRALVHHVLERPDEPLPPIDPMGWVSSRNYHQQDYEKKLESFLKERHTSVRWLQSLTEPKWDNAYAHPKFGPMTAKMFLCNWLAHDLHHIRQINALQHAYLVHTSGETLRYAGEW